MWQRLQSWLAGGASATRDADPQRWVVMDVESTGLDARTDRLVSIAALAVHVSAGVPQTLQIELADSFEVVLRHEEPMVSTLKSPSDRIKRNVLVHGIGLGAQAAGVAPAQALQAFADFAGDAPLLGYHSWFDQTLIERTFEAHGVPRPGGGWLDIEDVARGVHHEVRRMALDGWLARYGIECTVRHDAAADTLATAELLVRLWRGIDPGRGTAWQALQRVAGDARFLAHP